ncbi:FAD-dependent oxidoreductase [Mollicutes bacterium LVI A0078]|nr:FAD-dependent oxidoreductase [Mollicutes bacterium LVI A0075]WOO91571.1 FAD-dependent oxidoreductase [Mollicutes bacterium LVI A0078]
MNFLILGSSAAGINAARELRKLNHDANITVASKDKILVSRCILHHYIEGKRDETMLHFAGPNVIEEHNINFLKGYTATNVNTTDKLVTFDNGEVIAYDKLLIATGSSSFIPPVPGLREGKQVIGLRDLEDAVRIKEAIKPGMNIAIIGSGLVGMDALESLTHYDVNIHLVDGADHLLNLQLDERSSNTYYEAAKKFGVTGHFSVFAKEVHLDSENNVTGLELANGEKFDVDLIIASAGTRSNISFLQDSEIELWERGLKFDDYGRTNVEDVYGAGDVSGVHPIWPMAVKEGIIAATNMSGGNTVMDDFFASKATMNFFGIPTMSVGSLKEEEGVEFKIYDDGQVYRKLAIKQGKVVGAILQNDIDYGGILIQLIKRDLHIDNLSKDVFELDYSDFFNLDDNVEYQY